MNPGEGFRLLKRGEVIKRGDSFWDTAFSRWKATADHGVQFRNQNLVYRRLITADAKVDLGHALVVRASARAEALQMTLTAYVRQCVSGELARSNQSQIQAEAKTTPIVHAWQERHA